MILPRGFSHQPGYPVVGMSRANWLGRRVSACISSHYKLLGTEMLSVLPGFQIGGVDKSVLTPSGYGCAPVGTTGAYWNSVAKFCCFANGSSSVDSVVIYVTRTGSNGSAARVVDNGSGGGNGWDLETDASNGVILRTWNGGGSTTFTSTGTLNVGQGYLLSFTYDTSTRGCSWYMNGKLLQNQTVSVTSALNTALIMHCSDLAGANCGTNYAIHYVAFFNGYALTQMDHQALARNPWMLFDAPKRQFPIPASIILSPSPGMLSFTGLVPSINANTNLSLTPSAGALTLAGSAPKAGFGIFPPAGSMTLTGAAPLRLPGIVFSPAAGTLTLNSTASRLGLGMSPGTATNLTLTGFAPHLVPLSPGSGSLSLNGFAPTINIAKAIFTPISDDIYAFPFWYSAIYEFIGYNPNEQKMFLQYRNGVIETYCGILPWVAQNLADIINANQDPVPTLSRLRKCDEDEEDMPKPPPIPISISATPTTLSMNAPVGTFAANLSVSGGKRPFRYKISPAPNNFKGFLNVGPNTGTTNNLTLNSSGAGNLTSGTLNGVVQVTDSKGATASISIGVPVGGALPLSLFPGAGSLAFAGFSPTLLITPPMSFSPGSGALVLNGFAPTLTIIPPMAFSPGVGALVFTGVAPSLKIIAPIALSPGAGTLSFTGNIPSVIGDSISLSPNAGSLSLHGNAPALNVGASISLSPGAGSLSLTGRIPTVSNSTPIVLTPAAASLSLVGHAPTVNSGTQTLIAQIGLQNTSSSTVPINSSTEMLGHIYKQGDLPANPAFALSDGTLIPFSKGQRANWPGDTTALMEVYLLKMPKGITTAGDTIKILNNGSAPTPSGLTLSMISSVTDYKMVGTLFYSPTPTEIGSTVTASLNDAILNGTQELYCDGNAGAVYIVKGDFRLGGAIHGQLKAMWFVQLLPVGCTPRFRVLLNVWQPNWDIDTPTKGLRAFSALTFQNGSTVIRDLVVNYPGNPYTVNWAPTVSPKATFTATCSGNTLNVTAVASGLLGVGKTIFGAGIPDGTTITALGTGSGGIGTYTLSNSATIPTPETMYVPGYVFQATSGDPNFGSTCAYGMKIHNPGALPGGFVENQLYFTGPVNPVGNGQFTISNNPHQITNSNSSVIQPTSAGSGASTVTLMPYLTQFYGFYSSGMTAKYDAFDASGNLVADTPLRFTMDPVYWTNTKALLPYLIPVASASNLNLPGASVYLPNGAGGYPTQSGKGNGANQAVGETGDGPDLGPKPLQYTKHLFTQSALDENAVRCLGMMSTHWAMRLRTSMDGQPPAVNNGPDGIGGSYAGLSGPYPQFRWQGSGLANLNGHSLPSAVNGYDQASFFELNTSHMPNWASYPLMRFGEPQYREQLIDCASNAIVGRNKGTPSTDGTWSPFGILATGGNLSQSIYIANGNTYYGCLLGDPSERLNAWAIGIVADGAALLAETHPFKPYLLDLLQSTYDCWNDVITVQNAGNPGTSSFGIFEEGRGSTAVGQPHFPMGYRNFTTSMAYNLTQKPAILQTLNFFEQWPQWCVANQGGAGMLACFQVMQRNADACQPVNITNITRANPGVVTVASNPNFNSSNWTNLNMVGFYGVNGMTQVNGNVYRIANINFTTRTFELHDVNDNPVDTTLFSAYTSGGVTGAALIRSVTEAAGSRGFMVSWVTTSPCFTGHLGSMAGADWVNYAPQNGDSLRFVTSTSGNAGHPGVPNPDGVLPYQTLYMINVSGQNFDLTKAAGDVTQIVRPTTSSGGKQYETELRSIISPPPDKCVNPEGGGTFQLMFGSTLAAAASGATVNNTTINALQTMFNATVTAGKCNPNTNSKYIMRASYT